MNGNNAKETHRLTLIGMPCWGVNQPFHSLAVVAGVAREAGFAVSLYDLNIDFYRLVDESERKWWEEDNTDYWKGDDLPQELWEKRTDWLHDRLDTIMGAADPSLICFSVNSYTRYFSVRAAKYLKSVRPDIPIMFGGVDCFPGEANTELLSGRDTPHCDIICQGECEIAFRRYLKNFIETGDWRTQIPGFAYYDRNTLVDTGDTELPTLKEKQPLPAFDLFDLSLYTDKGSLPFYLSRGCVYRCNFCSERPNSRRCRCRSAGEAVEEIKTILLFAREYADVPTLHFSDSLVNANMKILEEFVDLIIENGIQILWGGQGHIHHLLTHELLEKMKRAGFVSVFWGIESGSQHVVDLMNKKYSWADARRVLNDCSELGIAQHIPIVLGFPGETPEDIVDTIEFIFRFQDKPLCTIHTPRLIVVRPKSPLFERYSEFGLANNKFYDWSTVDLTNTLPVRVVRRFVASQAHGNRKLSMENLVDTKEIARMDLDDPAVARDLFRLIHEIFSRAGESETFYTAIDTWDDETPLFSRLSRWLAGRRARSKTPAGMMEDAPGALKDESGEIDQEEMEYLWRWNRLSKGAPDGRREIFRHILIGLGKLRATVKSAENGKDEA